MHDVAMCMAQIRHNNLKTCSHASTEEHKALQSSAKLCVSQFCLIGNSVLTTMQESIPISIR
nr:MAG TPA: hypothetical protein [Caudoviricetes sp.]